MFQHKKIGRTKTCREHEHNRAITSTAKHYENKTQRTCTTEHYENKTRRHVENITPITET
jgi:hypothetical protein